MVKAMELRFRISVGILTDKYIKKTLSGINDNKRYMYTNKN